MKIVALDKPFSFDYPAASGADDLLVAGRVYDISSGTAVFLSTVAMPHVSGGVYSGRYTAFAGKTYLVVSGVFTDGGYSTPDPLFAARSEQYQSVGIETTFCAWDYTAYDQDASLYVRAKVYDTSAVTPAFVQNVVMAHVTMGAYLGTFTGTLGKSYLATKSVYSDAGFTTVDPLRAPGGETFGAFGTVVNIVKAATIEGLPMEHTLEATIFITQGDEGLMELRAFSAPGVPFDLTGATYQTKINGQDTVQILPNGQHTTLDQTDPDTKGSFTLSFTDVQSAAFKWTPDGDPAEEIVTIVTQGASIIAFHGVNALRVDRNIPRQNT